MTRTTPTPTRICESAHIMITDAPVSAQYFYGRLTALRPHALQMNYVSGDEPGPRYQLRISLLGEQINQSPDDNPRIIAHTWSATSPTPAPRFEDPTNGNLAELPNWLYEFITTKTTRRWADLVGDWR